MLRNRYASRLILRYAKWLHYGPAAARFIVVILRGVASCDHFTSASPIGSGGMIRWDKIEIFFGPKWVVQIGCLVLPLDCLLFISRSKASILFFISTDSADVVTIIYLAAGAIAGFASNAIQAASRSLLVRQIDISESTEAFGLYDLASRVTAFTGPLSVALLTQMSGNQRVGIIPVVFFLLVGAICLQRVDGKQQRD